jgi:hypothetical protein
VLALGKKVSLMHASGKKFEDTRHIKGEVTNFEITKTGDVFVTVKLNQSVGEGHAYENGVVPNV